MPSDLQRKLSDATIYIRDQMPHHPKLGITLGSGLSAFADQLENPIRIPFGSIPHFSPPTVDGHSGFLVCGQLHGVSIAALQGRTHYYEGHDMASVVFPTRVLKQLGITHLLLTNAAGGLDPSMKPGDFMVIRDHINLTGANPLRGPNPEFLGPRFPDMTHVYSLKLRDLLSQSLKSCGARCSEGVYCGVSGPCYETAAEIRFLQIIGAQAVGMSTVAEAIAARHAGLEVAGLSCITNLATGLSQQELTHEEVKETARTVEATFVKALSDFVRRVQPHLR